MTPEERFNQQVWEILQDLKEKSLATEKGKPVKYPFGHFAGVGIIPRERKEDILFKLQEWGALRIRENPFKPPASTEDVLYLDLIKLKFDKIYKKYKSLNESGKNAAKKVLVINEQTGEKDILLLLSSLQRRYEYIIKQADRDFFLGIADYIKFIIENTELNKIATKIKQFEAKDEEKILLLEKQVRADIERVIAKTYEIIEKNKIINQKVQVAIKQYEDVRDGRTQSSSQIEEALYAALSRIISVLYETDYKNKVSPLIIVSETGGIQDYKISSAYWDYVRELQKFREMRQRTVWGSWDSLTVAYLVIHKFEDELKGLDSLKDFWTRMNFIGVHGEMQELLNGQKKKWIQFDRTVYSAHLDKVHNFFVEEINLTPEARQFVNLIPKINLPQINFVPLTLNGLAESESGFARAEIEKKIEETEIRKLQLEKLRMEVSKKNEGKTTQNVLSDTNTNTLVPDGWGLVPDNDKAHIKRNETIVFTFPNTWSLTYLYFECVWEGYGQVVEYKTIYEYKSKLTYPTKKGEPWKVNKSIRDILNKLKKDKEFNKLPFEFVSAKGIQFKIND